MEIPTILVRLIANPDFEVMINQSDFDNTIHFISGSEPHVEESSSEPVSETEEAEETSNPTIAENIDITSLNTSEARELVKVVPLESLDALEATELAGKARKKVLDAITARRAEFGG